MNTQETNIDKYFKTTTQWKEVSLFLRNMLLKYKLCEEWKWNAPCYTYNGANVIILGGYKSFFAISFLKGVLLNDPTNSLVFAGKNSKIAKLIKVKSIQELQLKKDNIENLIKEAILVEKKNLKVVSKQSEKLNFPIELLEKFDSDVDFKKAFIKLTKGRQRGYTLFFNDSKQSITRVKRIEKYYNRILDGKGIHDCICGKSKRMPTCDGSHKNL